AKALVDSKRVRALGTTGPKAVKGIGVEPIADQGVKGFDVRSWQGVFVPAGTPDVVVNRLSDAIESVLNMPDIRARMDTLGIEPSDMGPSQFAQFQSQEIDRWGKVLKSAGIKAE